MNLRDTLRRPRLLAAAACFALGAAVLLLGWLPNQEAPAAPPALLDLAPLAAAVAPAAEEVPTAPAELVVYVTGAVARPDVYRLAPDARVKDVVMAAGGLLPEAAADQVNLAEPLSDAAHVHIPAFGEEATTVARAPAAAPLSAATGLLDLNTASAAELEDLPGIGATLAGRIIARRSEAGPFGAVEDLREVTGVGEKLYSQIAPLVTVGP
jgi:competence protein ComEA